MNHAEIIISAVVIKFLGTGGATTTPRPGCSCRVCREALKKGPPYSRGGPSILIDELLLDTPETLREALLREGITSVSGLTYSHFHRDHAAGVGALEEMLVDHLRRQHRQIPLYATEALLKTLLENYRVFGFYLNHLKIFKWVRLEDLKPLKAGGLWLRPVPLKAKGFYALEFWDGAAKVLVVHDHLNLLDEALLEPPYDLAILEMGYVLPLKDGFWPPPDHRIFQRNVPIERAAELGHRLARRVIFTHVEEVFGRSHDELRELGESLGVEFAHDGLEVRVGK